MRAAKVQASLRIRAVSPEPPLLAHTGSESKHSVRKPSVRKPELAILEMVTYFSAAFDEFSVFTKN